MQRDMDLIRQILIQMAEHEHGFAPQITVAGHTEEEVSFHVWLMADAKLIDAKNVTNVGNSSPRALPLHLTWQGYEFLEATRSERDWEDGKKVVLSKIGGLSFELIKAYLMSEAKRHLGIS